MSDTDLALTLRYLRDRHAKISKRIDYYTSSGYGAPGFVEQLQRDLRGIEETLVKILSRTEGG